MEVRIIIKYTKFTYSIYFEGNKYVHIFFKVNFSNSHDKDNFTKLCNEFHNETPLIAIEDCFLPVLANII